MTSYAAVVSLINTMRQIQSHPRISLAFDNKQFEFLFEKLGFLLHYIKGNSHGGSKEEELECLIARAAHATEDMIESHLVDQIRGAGPISLLDLRSVLITFDSPIKEVTKFEKEKESSSLEQIGSADESIQPMERFLRKKTMIIGFEEELNQLVEMLIGQQSSRQIIPIVGMGGIGKTTLATSAYENQNSVDHFDILAWATISQNYNLREILLQLLSIKSKSTAADTGTEEELGLKLHKILCGRRYLITLDDLWSVEAWEKIMCFFPDNNNGSRVVVTTRLTNMGTYFGSSCLAKRFLEEDQSWKLFQEKAFGPQGCPPELEEIGMEIAKKCKGLPLLITVIGGFLGKSPTTKKYWENVAKDINSILNSDDHEQRSNILSTSYTYLPAHLKPCFLYMGVFREDEEIRVSRLVKLWVSEGFLEPNEATQTLEEIAEVCVNDLVDRNLIVAASRREVSGKIKTCKVHDVLWNLCLRIGEKEKFLRVVHPFNFPQDMSSDRRLVLPGGIPDPLHKDDMNYYCPQDFEALQSASLARSVLSPRGHELGFELRFLRVLEKVDWPMKFIDQVNLRYLSFFANFSYDSHERMDELPMWNLQTLIGELDGVQNHFDPLAIWEMQNLRHLENQDFFHLPDPEQQQRGGLVLRNLQTLTGVTNLKLNAEVCRRIPNVTTLGITYFDHSGSFYDCYHCLGNLRQLHKLESLRLYFFCYSYPQPPDLMRKLLFPSALRKLTIGECEIRWEDLTFFGCCPNLQVLKLGAVWLIGSEWSPVEGQFLRLKKLKIHAREDHDLTRWSADCTHFPVLEKLVLSNLRSLEEIPSGIGDIPTLRCICLKYLTYSAALSAVRIVQDQLDNSGYEDFQVKIEFLDRMRLEKFKELVGSFTCNNVQLTSRDAHIWEGT